MSETGNDSHLEPSTRPERVVLVDDTGQATGSADKLAAHRNGGNLHSAFSILVFNRRGELLLQRRAATKYHFAGLWSNTCCGHPRPGEGEVQAAERRLGEEFGFTVPLRPAFHFRYEAYDAHSGLTEREIVQVLVGRFHGAPMPDRAEIGDWRWQLLEEVQRDRRRHAERYTPWFRLLLLKTANTPSLLMESPSV